MIGAASPTISPGTNGVDFRRKPLRRFQQDERLVGLIRQGHDGAFEILFNRYQPQLLAYCRNMVGSTQDAEDVLQEVFAAAHATMLADHRPIHPRPWLYRIARNRCINHLRKPTAQGVDSMDVHPYEHGTSTLEMVEQREELRAIVADVRELPKTQRTALVLREIGDLSYPDIARTMGKSLPSVKSLLVRARMSLSESSDARPALVPFGLVALLRKLIPAKLGGGSDAGATAGSVGSAGSATGPASAAIGGALSAKAAVGLATAALVTAGAVGVHELGVNGNHGTPRAGGSETSAGAGARAGTHSSVHSRPAGAKAPRGAARTTASRTDTGSQGGTGSGSSPASTPGQVPVEPALPVEPPTQPAPSQGPLAGSHVAQAAAQAIAPVRDLVPGPAASTVDDVIDRVNSLTPPRRTLPPLDLDALP